jgi:hypothetical protein
MTKLKTILTSYANVELAPLGARKTRTIQVDKLREELHQTVRRNNWLFAVCIVLAIVLFGVQLWVALTYMTQPNVVKAIAGIFGISAAGLVTQMIKLWQEKLATELLLGLLPVLDSAVLTTVINALVKRLK